MDRILNIHHISGINGRDMLMKVCLSRCLSDIRRNVSTFGSLILTIIFCVAIFPTSSAIDGEPMLISPGEVRATDLLMDISSNTSSYIPGAVSISYEEFFKNSSLKSLDEIARILGDNGISNNDSIVIYGKCLPCGGGPAPATFVYWMMRYLGHKNVTVLNGGLAEWVAEGLPAISNASKRDRAIYIPHQQLDMVASYSYVSSGEAQIVDARTPAEYLNRSIPGSINIPNGRVANGEKIKNDTELKALFAGLDRNRPIVVFTNTGVKASIVWFALSLEGYNAKLYTFMDWVTHERNKVSLSATSSSSQKKQDIQPANGLLALLDNLSKTIFPNE